MTSIYLIGSLKNPLVTDLGVELRKEGFEIFDEWAGAGPEADDEWQKYEKKRGRTYKEALNGYAARQIYDFDKKHLDRCDMAVLVMPGGKSAHLELGYMIGKGKKCFYYLDAEPARFDVMPLFVTDTGGDIIVNRDDLIKALKGK